MKRTRRPGPPVRMPSAIPLRVMIHEVRLTKPACRWLATTDYGFGGGGAFSNIPAPDVSQPAVTCTTPRLKNTAPHARFTQERLSSRRQGPGSGLRWVLRLDDPECAF